MKTIWKYPLRVDDRQVILMPKGAKLLNIQVQGNAPCLWAEVDDDQPLEDRCFLTYGTGHPVNREPKQYIGTYQIDRAMPLVFHVYEATGQ